MKRFQLFKIDLTCGYSALVVKRFQGDSTGVAGYLLSEDQFPLMCIGIKEEHIHISYHIHPDTWRNLDTGIKLKEPVKVKFFSDRLIIGDSSFSNEYIKLMLSKAKIVSNHNAMHPEVESETVTIVDEKEAVFNYLIEDFGNPILENQPTVFCTSHIKENPKRYQDWIDYYSALLKGYNIRLLLVNDGPIVANNIDYKEAIVIQVDPHIGEHHTTFAGWKRSYRTALDFIAKKSLHIAHIESDCFLLERGKDKFIDHLINKLGYFSGFTKKYNHMESAIQIINDLDVVNFYRDEYSSVDKCREGGIESYWQEQLSPSFIFMGERYEDDNQVLSSDYDYIAQANIDVAQSLNYLKFPPNP